jgi:predicted Rossmann-fold nucleotide-binding protein
MGAASDGALASGGRVEGVILRRFWRQRHRGLHSLKSSATFARRKAGLFEGAQGAIVFPGGYGTLDELSDLLALKQNGFTELPVVVLNTRGYYDALLRWVRHAGLEGFLYGPRLFSVAPTPQAAVRQLRLGLRPRIPR